MPWWQFSGSTSPRIEYSSGVASAVIKTQGDGSFSLWENADEMNDSLFPTNHWTVNSLWFFFGLLLTLRFPFIPLFPGLHWALHCWKAAGFEKLLTAWSILLAGGLWGAVAVEVTTEWHHQCITSWIGEETECEASSSKFKYAQNAEPELRSMLDSIQCFLNSRV